MDAIIKLSLKELIKKRTYTLLTFSICLIAMNTIFSSITNATSALYQKKQFEENLGFELGNVLHLHYRENAETDEFATVLSDYKNYLREIEGVTGVGQFDSTHLYFSELENNAEYQEINPPQYENYPAGISWVVTIDEELLPLIKDGITEYSETSSGYLPIYPSEIFRDVIPIGTILSNKYNEDKFEVAGYIPKGSKWVDENDLIRFPLISLDGAFVAPYTESSKSDIWTQLPCMQNTYVFLSKNADVERIKQEIHDYTITHGFDAYAETLEEEYDLYSSETEYYTTAQTALAIFISMLSLVSIVAVFTTNTLLRRTQYGILIANGFTIRDIAVEISFEIGFITLLSGAIMWILKLLELRSSNNLSIKLFRDILLTAHIRFTLPICVVVVIALTVISTLLPVLKVFQYRPCELIGDDTNGNY